MKVNAKDEKGRTVEFEAPNLNAETIEALNSETYTRKQTKRIIDNMNISADAKSLLSSIANTVIFVGEKIIQLGKKIIEIVMEMMKSFPNATFGMLLGLLLGTLVAAIPIIGVALGAFVTPIAAAFGLASGWMSDFQNATLKQKIMEAQQAFSPLAS